MSSPCCLLPVSMYQPYSNVTNKPNVYAPTSNQQDFRTVPSAPPSSHFSGGFGSSHNQYSGSFSNIPPKRTTTTTTTTTLKKKKKNKSSSSSSQRSEQFGSFHSRPSGTSIHVNRRAYLDPEPAYHPRFTPISTTTTTYHSGSSTTGIGAIFGLLFIVVILGVIVGCARGRVPSESSTTSWMPASSECTAKYKDSKEEEEEEEETTTTTTTTVVEEFYNPQGQPMFHTQNNQFQPSSRAPPTYPSGQQQQQFYEYQPPPPPTYYR